jgi:protein-S-isoprenylcysteine O-methyltransferase Ste14
MSETQNKDGGARVHFPPPLVFLALVGAGVAGERWTWPFAVPLVVTLTGAALVISARIWFTRTGQSPIPWKPSPELLVRGVYHHTRNPMYLGVTTFQLGLGVLLGNLWISILAPVALATVHFIAVRPEEAYLADKFGESYLRYKAEVRRYI